MKGLDFFYLFLIKESKGLIMQIHFTAFLIIFTKGAEILAMTVI